jgi:uncharacterized protein YdhG (YjbR/CyaY superfamily)
MAGRGLDRPAEDGETARMSREEIDDYLEGVDPPARATLGKLRETILSIVPEAEQCISYRIPAFRIDGQVIAGFAAFTNHLSYFPFSGSVLGELTEDIARYRGTKSALHFDIDTPLPRELVRKLIDVRLRHIRQSWTDPTC